MMLMCAMQLGALWFWCVGVGSVQVGSVQVVPASCCVCPQRVLLLCSRSCLCGCFLICFLMLLMLLLLLLLLLLPCCCCCCPAAVAAPLLLQRLQEMVLARIAAAPAEALAAATADASADGASTAAAAPPPTAAAASHPAEDIVDQTMNRVLIVKPHTPEDLKHWLNQLAHTVSGRGPQSILCCAGAPRAGC